MCDFSQITPVSLIRFGAVSRNNWFEKIPVEIFQCVKRRRSQSARARSQLRSDKGWPGAANQSHPRAEPRGWAARVVLKELLYVLLYHNGKFFNRKRNHI
jgi:hypothetical protein